LSEEKNPDVFVNVARKLLSAKGAGHLKFFIVGDGPLRGAVEKMINETASKNLVFLGYKPKAEVAKCLSASDVFVLPSEIEGFPLSILEAMAMNVAVVASDVGAVAEVIDSGTEGIVVAPGSVEEIVSAIKDFDADTKLLQGIKAKARAKVEAKYSNTILGDNYVRFYRGLLK
jgi:glycosyltransferase involved in cell wall biosynthesis